MLKAIDIHNLFDRYTYHIDLNKDSSFGGLLFLTGPNGMGKSTIFRMIWSLYHYYWDEFLIVRYDAVDFYFDDGYHISMKREASRNEEPIESDLPAKEFVEVLCRFSNMNNGEDYNYKWNEIIVTDLDRNESFLKMKQYLNPEDCFLISDSRLGADCKMIFDDTSIEPSKLSKLLNSIQQSLYDNSICHITFSTNNQVNEKRLERVKNTFCFLHRCGLEMPNLEKALKTVSGSDLNIVLERCESAFDSCKKEFELLKSFLGMMDKAAFINTEMVLDPKRGYRFKAKDSGRYIDFDNMSSGEQQYFCQMYNLYFGVSEKRLVMIDEPEISFHMMWQMNYCKQMKTLSKLRKLNLLISTHSPEMFDGDFSLTTDLYKQYRANNLQQ